MDLYFMDVYSTDYAGFKGFKIITSIWRDSTNDGLGLSRVTSWPPQSSGLTVVPSFSTIILTKPRVSNYDGELIIVEKERRERKGGITRRIKTPYMAIRGGDFHILLQFLKQNFSAITRVNATVILIGSSIANQYICLGINLEINVGLLEKLLIQVMEVQLLFLNVVLKQHLDSTVSQRKRIRGLIAKLFPNSGNC